MAPENDPKEYQQVKALIEAIDNDPLHTLPEGICGVIKLAKLYSNRNINGAIHYRTGFSNGFMVNCYDVVKCDEPGVYMTPSGCKYLVEVIAHG